MPLYKAPVIYGNWTPLDTSSAGLTFIYAAQATYNKIDKLVNIVFDVTYPTTSDANYNNISLPFPRYLTMGGTVVFNTLGVPLFYYCGYFTDINGNALTNAQLSGKRLVVSSTYRCT